MIAVIADDFTGAAELAGISLRYGLQVKLYTGLARYEASDVCIVSSNSRSLPEATAIDITSKIITALQETQPAFIYKKIDSVLRGHVLAELKIQLLLTNKKKAVIIPANPSLGRTISNGKYYIQDKLITQTDFTQDPEFPVQSADVKDLLHDQENEVTVVNKKTTHYQDLILAETASIDEIDHWVKKSDGSWLLAGAGDFFERLLASQFKLSPTQMPEFLLPHLYICGTTSTESRKFIEQLQNVQDTVIYLQEDQLLRQPCLFREQELDYIRNIVSAKQRLLLSIGEVLNLSAPLLRLAMASLVKQLVEMIGFKELFIEGGATAASVLEQLHLQSFFVTNELQRGVVRMQAGELFITVKPGSYIIPEFIRDLYLTNPNRQAS